MKERLFYFFLFSSIFVFSQEKNLFTSKSIYLQLDYFYANIVPQSGAEHLIKSRPKGFLISWNKRTNGEKLWEQYVNYPDIGFSFSYQDFKNKILGKLYGFYGHYNYYFLEKKSKNNIIFSFATGIAYSTRPYDKATNNKNVALGTHLNSTSFIKLFYQREHLYNNFGIQAGLLFIHASNGSFKAPNKGINTWGIHLGVNYDLYNKPLIYIRTPDYKNYKELIHFNLSIYTGVNESDYINTGIRPFAVITFFADKRFNRKNGLQIGAELDLHYYLKDYFHFLYAINGNLNKKDTPDWKRVGFFLGHEYFFDKTSIFYQLAYYVYAPSILNESFYERIGIKRYFNRSLFASISVKAHLVNAESLEFGVGYRF